jgi:O-antigen ligase
VVKHAARWVEYLYAVVVLFLLTQGPVYKMWEASGRAMEFTPTPSVLQAHTATFALIQLPAAALFFLRLHRRGIDRVTTGILAALVGWLTMSTVWSEFARVTVIDASMLVLTTMVGLYFVQTYAQREMLLIVSGAMQLGVAVSLWAIWRNWSLAVDPDIGYWIGIYFNRNSLAPPAAVGAITALGVAWMTMRRRSAWTPLWVVTAVVVAAIDIWVVWKSQSSTSVGAAVVFLIVWVFWAALRWAYNRRLGGTSLNRRWVYPAFLALVAATTTFILVFQDSFLRLVGQESRFNSRSQSWAFSWDGVLDKPLVGWGWMAAWRTRTFFQRDGWWDLGDVSWSHSGYFDILLGGGFVAGALFLALIIVSGLRLHRIALVEPLGQLRYAVAFFVLAAATQESFFLGTHFMWALLVWALVPTADEISREARRRQLGGRPAAAPSGQ